MTNGDKHDIINKLIRESEGSGKEITKNFFEKNSKKGLTNRKDCDIIIKLSERAGKKRLRKEADEYLEN
ncbi:MAG: hypothetical protein IJZ65_09590 [Ruminiclostridium sp.]|nr:hypothetical protein [Ruminiclostridium sp.]